MFGPRRTTLGTFSVFQMALTGVSGNPHWCSKLVPPLPNLNMPSGPICVTKRLILAYFCLFLAPIGPLLGHFGSWKWPKLVCLDVLIGVLTLFHPFQPKIDPLGRFVRPNGYFSIFWTLFGLRRAIFETFWVWKMSPWYPKSVIYSASSCFIQFIYLFAISVRKP